MHEQNIVKMFDEVSAFYDRINDFASLGIHRVWKKRFVKAIPSHEPLKILDVATGTGDILYFLKKQFPHAQLNAIDPSVGMLKIAQKRFPEINFKESTLDKYEGSNFDIITISFGIRNFENLEQSISKLHKLLKPGGVLAILEFGAPQENPGKFLMRSIGVVVRFLGSIFGNPQAYHYLMESMEKFPLGIKFLKAVESLATFTKTDKKIFFPYFVGAYYFKK